MTFFFGAISGFIAGAVVGGIGMLVSVVAVQKALSRIGTWGH